MMAKWAEIYVVYYYSKDPNVYGIQRMLFPTEEEAIAWGAEDYQVEQVEPIGQNTLERVKEFLGNCKEEGKFIGREADRLLRDIESGTGVY